MTADPDTDARAVAEGRGPATREEELVMDRPDVTRTLVVR